MSSAKLTHEGEKQRRKRIRTEFFCFQISLKSELKLDSEDNGGGYAAPKASGLRDACKVLKDFQERGLVLNILKVSFSLLLCGSFLTLVLVL